MIASDILDAALRMVPIEGDPIESIERDLLSIEMMAAEAPGSYNDRDYALHVESIREALAIIERNRDPIPTWAYGAVPC